MSADLPALLGRALGAEVTELRPLHGGDINRALAATLADGRRAFVKTHDRPPPGMYEREAEGLDWLRDAGALRVPKVLARGEAFLALELIAPARTRAGYDEQLGEGLARLHQAGAPSFGFTHDNYLATLPQPNAPGTDWPAFYGERRLLPLARAAHARALLPARVLHALDSLIERLPSRCGPPEPPARLHGDLWSGNVMADDRGEPCVIDPAVYGGHREVDLAMMRLFGGFSARVFDAYDACHPLAPGHQERVALYQLYPLLAHVNLFGGHYARAFEQALDRVL